MFSLDSANLDLRDHLITYVIEGLPGVDGPVWMLFFEDMNKLVKTPIKRTYSDFNDLAVEVRSIVQPVPLPPAGWAGLFTLSGAALVRGRKLFRKAHSINWLTNKAVKTLLLHDVDFADMYGVGNDRRSAQMRPQQILDIVAI